MRTASPFAGEGEEVLLKAWYFPAAEENPRD